MTATSNACGYAFNRSSTTTARFSTPDVVAAARGARDHHRPSLAEAERLEDLPGDLHLPHRLGGQRDAECVADPVGKKGADTDRALDRSCKRRSSLRHAEMQRVRHLPRQHPVTARIMVGTWVAFTRDLEVTVVRSRATRPPRARRRPAPRPDPGARACAGVPAASRSSHDPHRDAGLLRGVDDDSTFAGRCCRD